jgi:hypothetical protein
MRVRVSQVKLSHVGAVVDQLIRLCVCLLLQYLFMIKLFTRGGTREEPGTLTQGGALFSLVPLVWNRTQAGLRSLVVVSYLDSVHPPPP